MLSKEICRRCHNNQPILIWNPWRVGDDDRWGRNIVLCPVFSIAQETEGSCAVDGDPPSWCLKIFEHAVVAGMSNVL